MEKKFDVTGMGCSACSARIEKGLSKMEGVKRCEVNLLTNSMVVEFEGITSQDIIDKVDDLGYGASEVSEAAEEESHPIQATGQSEEEVLKKRFLRSLCFALPLAVISMSFPIKRIIYLSFVSLGIEELDLVYVLLKLVFVIPIIVINRKFYKSGIPALIHGSPNMDTLVSIGTIASLIKVNYLDSIGMILTFVTLGKWLEARAKSKTTDALKGLLSLRPETATVIRDGQELIVKTTAIRKGEIVLCHPGETIAVDGKVVKGQSKVNQANITGESRPVPVSEGTLVIGGTINIDGYFEYVAESVGRDTLLSKIISLVEEASSSKAPISRMADKVAGIFVPCVMGISLLTFIIWLIASKDPLKALDFAIPVLVISCPCALGLATPVSIMVGTGRGAKEGIIIKSAASLENLGKVDTVVFDKTGTITEGLVIDDVSLDERLNGDSSILNTTFDRIRPEAKEVISKLKAMGIMPVLLSGDKKEYALNVAKEVGIDSCYYEVLPHDKERVVRELQEEGKKVAMVGDGVNDAPAIARADVGLAIGTGTDIAIDSSDMVLMGRGIEKIEKAIALSKATVKNIKLSLFWAFIYNIICIPIAAGILYAPLGIVLNPMIAALCMSFSSVTVVTNALRLRKTKI